MKYLTIVFYAIIAYAVQSQEVVEEEVGGMPREWIHNPPCGDPWPPMNGDLHCGLHLKLENTFICKATCRDGFQYPQGGMVLKHYCDLSSLQWTPIFEFPDCIEICNPPCENNGTCTEENNCICSPNFRGDRCQFPTNLCNPNTAFHSSGDWQCNHGSRETSCMLTCPPSTQYEFQPENVYICTLEGIWTPSVAPKCQPINVILPADNPNMLFSAIAKSSELPESTTCASWNQRHYRTFDDAAYNFQGPCTYLLAKDCTDDTFSIHVKYDSSYIVTIYIGSEPSILRFVDGIPGITVNNRTLFIPTTINGLLFEKVSNYITVSSSLGFRLKWNENSVVVKVNSQLVNKTCGLCGRFDGVILNDFETPDGSITTNVETFVNSWTMEDLGSKCEQSAVVEQPCSNVEQDVTEKADTLCKIIMDSKFSPCHIFVDPSPYFEACKMDYCACIVPEDNCICESLSQYFQECVRRGGKLEDGWRNADLCPLICPNGMTYKDCGSSCPKTCKNTVYDCEDDHCMDGCHCPDGTVLHNGSCIAADSCPCIHNKIEYRNGERYVQDCNACECHHGKWQCSTEKCEARCSSVGDPHFTTFDGTKFEYVATCPVYLVYNDNFTIIQENIPCTLTRGAAKESISASKFCTKSITLTYADSKLILKHSASLSFNDREISDLPFSENGITVYMPSSMFTKVDLPNQLSLMWDGENRIYIDAPAALSGQTKGLCGTFNHNQKDDFITPDGDIEADVAVFASRWHASDNCHKRSRRSERDPCQTHPQNKADAEMLCSLLNTELFDACHGEVDPQPFYKGCVFDLCSCTHELSDCICPVLADYSSTCSKKGIMLSWIEQIRSCQPQCDPGKVYRECANPCQSSCSAIATSDVCTTMCVQGCSCPEGLTLNAESQCIPIDQCPCIYEGKEFAATTSNIRGSNICVCENAVWNCRLATLPELAMDVTTTDAQISCSPDRHEMYISCVEDCPITCQNMHLTQRCHTKICKAGCRCQDGYILDTDLEKCVKRSECGCRHAGRTCSEGHTLNKECNLCTCNNGMWDCTRKTCPEQCTVWGESHFRTYDGLIYDFHGDCDYILSKGTQEEMDFTISVQNVPCGGSGFTCSRSFTLDINVNSEKSKVVLAKDQSLPKNQHNAQFVILEAGLFVLVYTKIGVSLRWDKGTRMYITLDPKWRNKVTGLCGNFNDDRLDDFQTPSGGLPEVQPVLFADSWKVRESCPSSTSPPDACASHPNRYTWAHQKCSVLKSSLFVPCHSEVTLDPYYDRCVSDTCACNEGGDCDCLCTAIAAYAHECNNEGVQIKWRSQELCPIQCAECSTYDSCMSSCPRMTCQDQHLFIDVENACSGDICVEGCNPKPCPPGQIYNNSKDYKCIPEIECIVPCLEINGKMYNEGERISDPTIGDECQSCHCLRGSIVCTGKPCQTITVPPALVLNMQTECKETGWTHWINSPSSVGGDYEVLDNPAIASQLTEYCGIRNITDIECRLAGSKLPYKEAGQNVLCSIPFGLICEDDKQESSVCEDYEIRLFCYCGPEEEPPTLKPLQPAVVPVVCIPGWTVWMSASASKLSDTETYEILRQSHNFCSREDIQAVECRSKHTSEDPMLYNMQDIECSVENGLICKHSDANVCNDYEIRYYCVCGEEIPTCIPGWTKFFNTDNPQINPEQGDEEIIENIRQQHTFCANDNIEAVECKSPQNDEMIDYKETGQFGLKCSKKLGFICNSFLQARGESCYDYAIRFYCSCGVITTPAITTTTTVLPTTTLKSTTANPCPPGQIYDTCAYHCNQTCAAFAHQLSLDRDVCKNPNENGCIEGCRPIEGCHSPFMWRDYYNCVPLEECTCVIPKENGLTVVVAPNNIIEQGCEKCQCIHNDLTCYTIPGCGVETTTAPSFISTASTPLTTMLPTTFGAPVNVQLPTCWTEWINVDDPSSGGGDFEALSLIRNKFVFCADPVQIECRTIRDHKKPFEIGQKVDCSLENGLHCWNSDNGVEGCYDYEIRFYCPCETTTIVPTTTIIPSTMKPSPCVDGWTEWFNSNLPNSYGESETVQSARSKGGYFCSNDMLSAIECRIKDMNSVPLQHGVVCDLMLGLQCFNADFREAETCLDYEVRFYCDCPGKTTVTLMPTTTKRLTTTPLPKLHSCAYWSEWINDRHPSKQSNVKGVKSGVKGVKGRAKNRDDVEKLMLVRLQEEKNFCLEGYLSEIECRDAVTDVDYTETGDSKLSCSLAGGFRCRGRDQFYGVCQDYKIRYYCSCEVTATTRPVILLRPTVTTISVPLCNMYYQVVDGPYPLPDHNLKASTSLGFTSGPQSARLSTTRSSKSDGAWIASTMDDSQFLEVDVGQVQPIYGVITKGRNGGNEWVASYYVLYSRDGISFSYVMEEPSLQIKKVFSGNFDSNTPVEHIFKHPFEARYVRIQPLTYVTEIALRVDFLGCAEGMTTTTTQPVPVCVDEMGMQNFSIGDGQLRFSSDKNGLADPSGVRLNAPQVDIHPGGWVPEFLDADQFVEVDFYGPRTITGVITQGRDLVPQWVTAFTISYSLDGITYNYVLDKEGKTKIFSGNFDSDTPVTNFFPQPVRTRYLRINPLEWNNWISLRLEILGCYEPYEHVLPHHITTVPPQILTGVCGDQMGFENHLLPDSLITVSSSALPWSGVSRIRLNTHASEEGTGGWVPVTSDYMPVVLIDLTGERNLTGIITQGREDGNMWVMSYRLEYSLDNVTWLYFVDGLTQSMIFPGNHDRNTPEIRLFQEMITARFVKMTILDYHNSAALRLELLGCFKPYEMCIKYGPWLSLADSNQLFGDEEPIDQLISVSGLCANPLSIQCREIITKKDYSVTQENVICDLEHGLICKNVQQSSHSCMNYEARIGCWSCEVSTIPTSPLPLSLCSEMPKAMKENCPISCSFNHSCDGNICVPDVNCPCFREGKRFNPGDIMITSDCDKCECMLNGFSKCKPIICPPCPEGQKSEIDNFCQCQCRGCMFGTIPCPTSGQCIDEIQWCDGVVDCPDDEIDCPTTTPLSTTTTTEATTTVILPPICTLDIPYETATCEMNVNTFSTFDGLQYQYEICDHILVKEKSNEAFTVQVHKECDENNARLCKRYILLYVDDIEIKMGPGREDLYFNKYKVSVSNLWLLSRKYDDFVLKKRGDQLVFRSFKHNFEVVWDSKQDVRIIVSKCSLHQLAGLCGFFNGVAIDDFTTPYGQLAAGSSDFGDSWNIGDLDRCLPTTCSHAILERAVYFCKEFYQDPFSNCSSYLDLATRVEACISFICECSEGSDNRERLEACKCDAYESFAVACEDKTGIPLTEWRIKHDCTPDCQPGLEYKECGPGCQLTCDNYRDRETICEEKCIPGCYCPLGLIYHNGHCVKPKMCQDCVCRGHGDPNYITFDGHYYAFQGNCTYILAQHQSGDEILDFQILATNYECPEEPHTSCTAGLKIIWNGHTIEKFKDKQVFYDGEPLKSEDSPFTRDSITITFVPNRSTLIHIKEINLAVRYFDQMYGYNVELPAYLYYNKTEGLCGICNFEVADDMYHKSGFVTDDVEEFAYSWLIDDTRERCTLPRVVVPSPPPYICNFTANSCDLFIDPSLYSKSCQNDISYSSNPDASMCRSKFQYAQQCCERGVSLESWLEESGCLTSCPENMVFECTSACQKTCDTLEKQQSDVCDLLPLYTCACPPDYVIKDGHCVDPLFCKMCDDDHIIGDRWQVTPCKECECLDNLSTNCTITKCPEPPICLANETLDVLYATAEECCNRYHCKPAERKKCPSAPIPECDPGETVVLHSKHDCPLYKCECKNELCPAVVRPTSNEEGEVFILETVGCCSQYVSECIPSNCSLPLNCGLGFKTVSFEGKCCKKYNCVPKNNVCVYRHKFDILNGTEIELNEEQHYDIEYEAGSSWHDGLCRKCSCVEKGGQYAYSCEIEVCPEPSEFPDADTYVREPVIIPGACCPKYKRVQCIAGEQTYSVNEEWPSLDGDRCKSFRCIIGPRNEVVVLEKSTICEQTCPIYAMYIEPESDSLKCCGYCKPVACEENGVVHEPGSQWQSESKPCFTAECLVNDNMTQIIYRGKTCQFLPANCPKDRIVSDEDGCCPHCEALTDTCEPTLIPSMETTGYFHLKDNVRGLCSNSKPILNLTKCSGQCESPSMFSTTFDNFESTCKCCLPLMSKKRNIVLECQDGSQIEKLYQQPEACHCSACGQDRGTIDVPVPY